MRRKRFILILYVAVIVVFALVCADGVGMLYYDTNQQHPGKTAEINKGWTLLRNETTHPIDNLPKVIEDTANKGVITRKLPENLNNSTVLAFQNGFQDVQVKIDGVERYAYNGLLPNLKRRVNTNFLCMVALGKEDGGKQITIFFHSPLKRERIYLPDFFIGTESGIFLKNFRSDVSSLIFSGIMIFVAILLLAMFIREQVGKGENLPILAHSSMLMFLSGIWSISNLAAVHMCFHNEMVLAYLSFNSFMLVPVAVPIFYCDLLGGYKKFMYQLAGVASLNFVLQNVFYFSGKLQYIQMMPITYIVLLLCIFALIGISFSEFTKVASFYAGGFLIATTVYGGFYTIDVFRFFHYAPLDNARFFRYGVLTFIVIVFWICAKRVLCYVEVEVENRVYKELALRDVLTHLPNRAALEKRIESLEESGMVCSTLTVVLMDVNGLKPVNDRGGHDAGDRLLCEAARSIKDAFPEEKDAWYRLGGDEFVVLMTETEINNEECQKRLQKATEKWKNHEHGPVSISCGSKTVKNLKVTKEVVQNLMQEADQMMYKNKLQYYQKKINKRSSQETV